MVVGGGVAPQDTLKRHQGEEVRFPAPEIELPFRLNNRQLDLAASAVRRTSRHE